MALQKLTGFTKTFGQVVFKQATFNRFSTTTLAKEHNIDPTQETLLNEKCFLVDDNDQIIGQASKKDCHLVDKEGNIPLHRAFSVFLFDNKGHLLLQKRASQKITYPDFYTNSCCSHPVADFPGESEDKDALGVKIAARRRLNYELGIPIESIPLEKLNYIARIHYKDEGNGKWGEHEIDYVLFVQDNFKLKPNSNEISEISFVPRNELDDYLPTLNGPLTPWFRLILKHRLRFWWDNLNNLEEIKDHDNILRFKP